MLHGRVKAYRFNRLRILSHHRIGCRVRRKDRYELVWLLFLRTQSYLIMSWLRSQRHHLRLSSDDMNSVHMLSKCCQEWWGCSRVYLRLDNCPNLQFGSPILHISITKVVGWIPPSGLGQFIKPHLLLPKTLHAVLYCFWYCAHHPARFIILTQLTKLSMFFITFLIFPVVLIIGTWKITQTVSDSIQYLLKR